MPKSQLKLMVGQKRGCEDFEESLDFQPKRVKFRDLESVFRAEDVNNHNAISSENKQGNDLSLSAGKEVSQVTEDTLTLNALQFGRKRKKRSQALVTPALSLDHDVNVDKDSSFASDDCRTSLDDTARLTSNFFDTRILKDVKLDHNAEVVSGSVCRGSSKTGLCDDQLKQKDALECGSACGPLQKKDPMKVWKQMKQNGFMSTSHESVPVPKACGKKSKTETIKKRVVIAKIDQVDRFAKTAAPSGLLDGVNPGIISHLRSSRQVRSVIETLVRSDRYRSCTAGNKPELAQTNSERIDSKDSKTQVCSEGDSDFNSRCNSLSFSKLENEEDTHAPEQSSSATMELDNLSSLSNEESSNQANVSTLSLKAADVASQWLELLHQDIKGRLAALQRSKKRVRAVIETELPFLISKEFSSNEENAPCHTNLSVNGPSDAMAELHKARWNALFDQMDTTLDEEEKQLKSWLNQVNAMRLHCGAALFDSLRAHGMQQLATSDIVCRFKNESDSQKVLEVRAAAAAFYSTCNFLQSSENLTSL